MDTLHVDLPAEFRPFVEHRVSQAGYASESEYVRALIEADRDRLSRSELEGEIMKGLASGDSAPFTAEDWQEIRAEVGRRRELRKPSPAAE